MRESGSLGATGGAVGGGFAAGVGWPKTLQRSRKCSCAADRSFSSTLRHFAMNSCIVMGAAGLLRRDLHPGFDGKGLLPGVKGVDVFGPDGSGGCDMQNIKRAGSCLSGVGRA